MTQFCYPVDFELLPILPFFVFISKILLSVIAEGSSTVIKKTIVETDKMCSKTLLLLAIELKIQ
ncbi:hypothetical protein [Legionella bononiensis]|uniref:Uncharacterized protein n=1 Tax=Legionella bononiensis TaxID=2793102 RepID=A0ABS1WAL5_9GAMM|nr:hypothetical protein [Legionella bononiensis]MBL7480370.1 hypothetical protein [Legionella bononiensis]MBL7526398.1 hypothetical protein [Legionella bononiensis]MBL7563108.1 hypothetical protein [Legionella bononiensis]